MTIPFENSNTNEQRIAASGERFRALVTATSDVIYSLTADWSVMRELDGRGFLKDTHEPVADWRSRNLYPDDVEKVNSAVRKAIQTKTIYQLEHRVLRADGSLGWTFSRAVPILDDQGEIIEWFGAASDITERKLAEEELQKIREQSEQQRRLYETITSNTPDLMYVFDLNYRFTYANGALLTMWGKDWDNAIGKSLLENGYEPWHAEMHEREIDKIKETKQPIRGEVSFPHAVLGKRIYDYILTPVFNDKGEVEAVAGTTRDITDINQWQEKLKDASQKLQAINEEMAASNEELAATNEELAATNEELIAANEELLRIQDELRYQTTEKQKAIDQLNAANQNMRNMVRQAPVGMCIVEGDPLYMVEINDSFLEIIGKTREEATTKPYWEVVAEAEAYYRPITERVFETGESFYANEHEIMLVRNGVPEIVHLDFVYEPMKDFSGKPYAIMIVAIDVTDKVMARKKVEEAEESLRMAISAAELGTWFIHSVTREFITDARLKELFGYNPDEDLSIEQALAQITDEFRDDVTTKLENAICNNGDYDVTYPVIGLHDNRLRWLRAIGNLKADPSGEFSAFTGVVMDITEQYLAAQKVERAEESLRMAVDAAELGTYYINATDRIFYPSPRLKEFFGFRPDEEVPYDAAINQIHPDYRQKAADMVEAAFTKGERFDMEYPVIGRHDGKTRWVRGIGTMQRYDGKDFFTGILNDITESKQDEMRKNDFIGMVSHELKTPLTSLNAIIQVANAKLKGSDDQFLAGAMEKANIQVKRMSSLINGFLNISRLESGKILIEKNNFDIEELVTEITEEQQVSVTSHRISLIKCDPISVYADRDKISSVISNLVSNAVKYSPNDTTIEISCTVSENVVMVSVKDEGIGIKPTDAKKIFERYYRVESSNTRHISGFGIGLYLSAEIVERHDGKIGLESEFGKGSKFYFTLPLAN